MPACTPGDRLRIESELPPDVLLALREVCRLLGVRPDRWHLVPAVARCFETAAVAALAERVQAEEGKSWKDSVDAATIQLGLNCDTVLSRLYRWPLTAYGHAA
jgi:hypothetical protein